MAANVEPAGLQVPGTGLWLRPRQAGAAPARLDGQCVVLNGETRWLLKGPAQELQVAAVALEGFCERLAPELVELSFGNAVGMFGLGRGDIVIKVVSGKWDGRHFDGMLADITRVAAALPFAGSAGGALPYDRSLAARDDVLYHAFVYLRHILLGDGAPETRLLPALDLILREPHRRWRRTTAAVPVEEARWVDPAGLERLVQGREPLLAVGSLNMPLARALGGQVPRRVEELRVQSTVDTPENRFVKAFLDQADGVVQRMRRAAMEPTEGGRPFRRRVLDDCDAMAKALARPRREGRWLWDEVGRMTYLPAGSTVLQLRRGYREVLGHFVRLRLATRLPLTPNDARQLLEIKDIALLYELWTYFMVLEALARRLGPPVQALTLKQDSAWGHELREGLQVRWPGGLCLSYNLGFSRGAKDAARLSYSVPLRPDIVVTVPEGPGRGLHLLDAKFRLQRVADLMGVDAGLKDSGSAGAQTDDMGAGGVAADGGAAASDEELLAIDERRGSFKRADLYKMHTYRDAIQGARSVWALYPGDEARFFPAQGHGDGTEDGAAATGAAMAGPLGGWWELPASAAAMDGVGALPLVPGEGGCVWMDRWVGVLLGVGGGDKVEAGQ